MENRALDTDRHNIHPHGSPRGTYAQRTSPWPRLGCALALLITLSLAACNTLLPVARASQSPSAYINGALDWIEAHDYVSGRGDWDGIRSEALRAAEGARTTAETYKGIRLALKRLGDRSAFFLMPGENGNGTWYGLLAVYPSAAIVSVMPRGPADRAGVRIGDIIEAVNGEPTFAHGATMGLVDLGSQSQVRLALRRAGQAQLMDVTLSATRACERGPSGMTYHRGKADLGYLSLPGDCSLDTGYATVAQAAMRQAGRSDTCGWVLDLRQMTDGDIWKYLAAVGPILGEGDVGGFIYASGKRETWSYRNGRVFWAENERTWEDQVDGPLYRPGHALPPVALLTGPGTISAGELLVVAFSGRPGVRRFGEPTQGLPFLLYGTDLSDGAAVWVGAAAAADRTGQTYSASIPPDQTIQVAPPAWRTEGDAALNAALDWLASQPDCAV